MPPKRKAALQEQSLEPAEEQEEVEVDFDFFDFEEIDYTAVGLLLRQLFHHDAVDLDIPGLSTHILEQRIGSTVKCDGKESDPYAFCTVLNLTSNQNPAVKGLISYLTSRTSKSDIPNGLHAKLRQSLAASESDTTTQSIGLILNERLLNMPPHITAPFLRLLLEELEDAKQQTDKATANYTDFLFFSRIYVPSGAESQEDFNLTAQEPAATMPKKKAKKQAPSQPATIFPYHIEDEVIAQFASETVDFAFIHSDARQEDSFGVDTKARLMLVPYDRMIDVVNALEKEGEA